MSADLTRFHKAQERMYERALAEIRAGQKQSHWMWFIFPQIDGLGFSETTLSRICRRQRTICQTRYLESV